MSGRRDGTPVIVSGEGHLLACARIPFGEKAFSEEWLQHKIHQCPEILPIDEIEPAYRPLIPIGMEIPTAAGPIDNLFVSPQGLVTLVEAKLWKNAEARRMVVGQILDYAKELSSWRFDDLDERARKATGKSLYELVCAASSEVADEPRFIDSVVRNLRTGRFLLIIAGDGIREEVERIAEFLQDSPQLRFRLALVELQLFRLDAGNTLIMPILVGHTVEIERAVVRVESPQNANVSVSIDLPTSEPNAAAARPNNAITEQEFLDELTATKYGSQGVAVARGLLADFGNDDRFQIVWGSASMMLKLRDPIESRRLLTLLVLQRDGTAYTFDLDKQLTKVGLPAQLATGFVAETAALIGRKPSAKNAASWDRNAPLESLEKAYGALKEVILGFADSIYRSREVESRI
jgi:hypothetical protein